MLFALKHGTWWRFIVVVLQIFRNYPFLIFLRNHMDWRICVMWKKYLNWKMYQIGIYNVIQYVECFKNWFGHYKFHGIWLIIPKNEIIGWIAQKKFQKIEIWKFVTNKFRIYLFPNILAKRISKFISLSSSFEYFSM